MVVGLGNPGPRYDATRHNVGWWVLDRLAHDWEFGFFESRDTHWATGGVVGDHTVELRKPSRYMNRSGLALLDLVDDPDFDPARDLLIVVDDANLDVGQLRFRPRGRSGGHNGLRSVAEALGGEEYCRLRIGVGRCPDDVTLTDWVLSPMGPADEEQVVELLPDLTGAVKLWLDEGVEAAMNRFNR